MTFSIHNILFCYLPCPPLCLHHLPNHNNNNNNLNSADHKNRKRRNSIPTTRWLRNILFKYIIGLRRIHFRVQEYSIFAIFHSSSGSRSRYANSPCSPLSLQLQFRIIIQGHKLVNYNFDSCLPSHSHSRGDLPRQDRPVAVAGRQSHRVRLLQRLPGQCQPVPVVQLEQLNVRDGRAEWECIPGNA